MKTKEERIEAAMQLGDIVHIIMDRMSGKTINIPGHPGEKSGGHRRKDKK